MDRLDFALVLTQTSMLELKSKTTLTSMAYPKMYCLKDKDLWNELVAVGGQVFNEPLKWISQRLTDPEIAIAAIDVPVISGWDEIENMFWGIVAVSAITGNLLDPVSDPKNNIPFSIYSASEANEQAMKAAGLRHFSPKEKLGFHSDGLLRNGQVIIPHRLMIYNLQISYESPGKFHWMPLKNWSQRQHFADIFGVGKKYKIALTPIVYSSEDGHLEAINSSTIEAPIFSRDSEGRNFIFWNGKLAGQENNNAFDHDGASAELSASLANSEGRISIDQRPRRAMFMANTLGFHARDIFEGPLVTGTAITRSFIRAMDTNGVIIA